MPHLWLLRLASAQPAACFSRCKAFSPQEALEAQGSRAHSTGFNHSLTRISRSQHDMHKVRKIPCMWTQNFLSSDRFLGRPHESEKSLAHTRVPCRNSWLRTFVSGTYGFGGVRIKPLLALAILVECWVWLSLDSSYVDYV